MYEYWRLETRRCVPIVQTRRQLRAAGVFVNVFASPF